jgi:hypothetical protein
MIHRMFACLLANPLLLTATPEARAHAVNNEGTFRWIEVPTGAGQSPYELKDSSPFIRIVEKPHGDEHR